MSHFLLYPEWKEASTERWSFLPPQLIPGKYRENGEAGVGQGMERAPAAPHNLHFPLTGTAPIHSSQAANQTSKRNSAEQSTLRSVSGERGAGGVKAGGRDGGKGNTPKHTCTSIFTHPSVCPISHKGPLTRTGRSLLKAFIFRLFCVISITVAALSLKHFCTVLARKPEVPPCLLLQCNEKFLKLNIVFGKRYQ